MNTFAVAFPEPGVTLLESPAPSNVAQPAPEVRDQLKQEYEAMIQRWFDRGLIDNTQFILATPFEEVIYYPNASKQS
ncbi:hypothetical protein [Tellurirhabdus bombi]|uniref:hypothetical protein n=1 Tax=Tellurirhabdus bombi TaxID=2907205 RepID=UPI001F39C4DF|nr:hypothetical protein [Tellurirhabdus bombi]